MINGDFSFSILLQHLEPKEKSNRKGDRQIMLVLANEGISVHHVIRGV